MFKIGFSGTQLGMTKEQKLQLDHLLIQFKSIEVHHGDCVGADAEFHDICRGFDFKIIGHPPLNSIKRAFKECDELRIGRTYLDRNRDIVDEVNYMVFAPAEFSEVLRSGTWATIRYTNRIEKDYQIIYPDGSKVPN